MHAFLHTCPLQQQAECCVHDVHTLNPKPVPLLIAAPYFPILNRLQLRLLRIANEMSEYSESTKQGTEQMDHETHLPDVTRRILHMNADPAIRATEGPPVPCRVGKPLRVEDPDTGLAPLVTANAVELRP